MKTKRRKKASPKQIAWQSDAPLDADVVTAIDTARNLGHVVTVVRDGEGFAFQAVPIKE